MKRWTRKLLAGLLSFGMLLQAASPLSALAAEDAPVAAHTLTVTVGSVDYILMANGETVSSDVTWPSGYPAVSYDDGFVFSGKFTGEEDLKIAGTDATENVTIKAAQWCMEQGIMEAKTAETFKPEGWTPKLKVIEVWNKAFPKQ